MPVCLSFVSFVFQLVFLVLLWQQNETYQFVESRPAVATTKLSEPSRSRTSIRRVEVYIIGDNDDDKNGDSNDDEEDEDECDDVDHDDSDDDNDNDDDDNKFMSADVSADV